MAYDYLSDQQFLDSFKSGKPTREHPIAGSGKGFTKPKFTSYMSLYKPNVKAIALEKEKQRDIEDMQRKWKEYDSVKKKKSQQIRPVR